jgi:DNA-binding GntR family transcriptional regulator
MLEKSAEVYTLSTDLQVRAIPGDERAISGRFLRFRRFGQTFLILRSPRPFHRPLAFRSSGPPATLGHVLSPMPRRPADLNTVASATERRPRRAIAASSGDDTGVSATQRIVESVTTAIIERRLMPGTKLAEQQIADLFAVSRTIVRQALHQLSRDRLVTLEPARGARVAMPGVDEARQVFEVRAMVESAMIRRLCAVITDDQIAELRDHLGRERDAVARTDVSGRTRLLADFHVVLARQLGNEVLAQLLADLLSRCSLIALMHQSGHSAEHSQDEHRQIVDALERRDARAAVRLMDRHLEQVERNLRTPTRKTGLADALRPPTPTTGGRSRRRPQPAASPQ